MKVQKQYIFCVSQSLRILFRQQGEVQNCANGFLHYYIKYYKLFLTMLPTITSMSQVNIYHLMTLEISGSRI